jgi:hypothetical protein
MADRQAVMIDITSGLPGNGQTVEYNAASNVFDPVDFPTTSNVWTGSVTGAAGAGTSPITLTFPITDLTAMYTFGGSVNISSANVSSKDLNLYDIGTWDVTGYGAMVNSSTGKVFPAAVVTGSGLPVSYYGSFFSSWTWAGWLLTMSVNIASSQIRFTVTPPTAGTGKNPPSVSDRFKVSATLTYTVIQPTP